MSDTDLITLMNEVVLSGGSDTKASGLRLFETAMINSKQNIGEKNLAGGYLGIDTNGDSVVPNKLTYKNIYSTSLTPSKTLGSGAGTGATASVTGNNECGMIDLSTGSLPTMGGVVMTLTLSGSFTFPNKAICVLYPANDAAVGLGMLIASGGNNDIIITAPALVSLNGSTNYVFNYQIKGF